MRIVDALIEVLKDNNGLTSKEAYKKIIDNKLYSFGAKDPEGVVNSKLRRHCADLDFPSASPVKYFKIVGQKDNKNLYGIIREEDSSKAEEKTVKRNESLKDTDLLPEEKIDITYRLYKSNLKKQILDRIKSCHPSFFEKLVVDLLLKMGYGSDELAGHVTGRSHDGGIDGVIDEDKLGLSKIYIQAKRNDIGNTVGRPELQAFVGAMQDIQKGVFITTATFTKGAQKYAREQQQKRLKLIDGELLTDLMIKYGVGLEEIKHYTVYKVNEDYFE